ncbi:MAG: 4-alpha-glucanotransferase [Nitrospira bacterium HGW-Nitrospira-1]|nr:MAG: 4-alpha-glucanotransferase [Nitrospira bacterium HGW-Nitrospira-1]
MKAIAPEMINELSGLCGILPEYWDIFGKLHTASLDTKMAMLRAMKIPVASDNDIAQAIAKQKARPWESFVEPVFVRSVNDQPLKIPVYIPVVSGQEKNLEIKWIIEDETGKTHELKVFGDEMHIIEERTIDNIRYLKVLLSDELRRNTGYYTADIECKLASSTFPDGVEALRKKTRLIVTPDTCYLPQELQQNRMWGLSANLYSVHSKSSWGIGDFKDLRSVVDMTAGLKADFVGVNPLHAIPNMYPYGISPYSPITRLYKNFIYLDIEDIPEVIESDEIRAVIQMKSFKRKIEELKMLGRIDYAKASQLKEQILRHAFDFFYERHYKKNTDRDNHFREFLSAEGRSIECFAVFLALWDFFRKTKNMQAWHEWPEEYHDPYGDTVNAFKKEHEKEALYYMYLQWLIDSQLMKISRHCREVGMKIGLYHDLAVGAISNGSDVWGYQKIIGDADVGAPPDDFNPNGQNWGFPPMIPDNLKENGYELFIETVRKNMKYGGALRIDHALGLFRLFWIPAGMSPADGAYLLQPAEDFLRIIALESERNKTIVIAEDLGTIDDTFRQMLQSFHMLSYRLFYFERNYPDPSFKYPDQYPSMALCAITTHDLPTIYGYWAGRDIEVKKQTGIYRDEEAWRNDVIARERDKGLILSALKAQGIIPADFPEAPQMIPHMTHELCIAIYRYLAQSPCKLLLVSLDDILGTLDQQNMPGTVDSHPNWMRKTPVSIEDMVHDKSFSDLLALFDGKRTQK